MKEELQRILDHAKKAIKDAKTLEELETVRVAYLGRKGQITNLLKGLADLSMEQRKEMGELANRTKDHVEAALAARSSELSSAAYANLKETEWIDVTAPGIRPPDGHLHLVTKAVREIEDIFKYLGFTRRRYPEVEWDWYAFEALNMPKNHPARDEWETFFIARPKFSSSDEENFVGSNRPAEFAGATDAKRSGGIPVGGRGGLLEIAEDPRYGKMVLTPHTSSGQIRELERGELPIRMINIGKCYRRQSDISHVPMFHQFEGLLVDKNVSIANLKGVLEYFAKMFFGPERKIRLRPFHFRFTEPSFEIDVSCGVCLGSGCRLCKGGWLELGGAGMVHPNVFKATGVDPKIYSGFAFGWGVERTAMMKSGLKIDDIRILYKNDVRFLEQF